MGRWDLPEEQLPVDDEDWHDRTEGMGVAALAALCLALAGVAFLIDRLVTWLQSIA